MSGWQDDGGGAEIDCDRVNLPWFGQGRRVAVASVAQAEDSVGDARRATVGMDVDEADIKPFLDLVS